LVGNRGGAQAQYGVAKEQKKSDLAGRCGRKRKGPGLLPAAVGANGNRCLAGDLVFFFTPPAFCNNAGGRLSDKKETVATLAAKHYTSSNLPKHIF
jgi:hypothetical protein